MKTIGERFDEMAEVAGVSKTDKSYYFGMSCCFQIATEQKAIDEKEMFAEREKAFNNGYEVAKKELIEKALEWLKMYDITFTQTPSMLEDFKRAMEEV